MLSSLSRPRPRSRRVSELPALDAAGVKSLLHRDNSVASDGAAPYRVQRETSTLSVLSSASTASRQAAYCGYTEAFPVEGEVGAHLFRKLKLVGRGGVGKVYLAHLKDSDPVKVYAIKEMDKNDMLERNKVKRVMTEREIFATANHPFIVTMYASFQTKQKLYFVMDYCAGGEFFKVLQARRNQRLSEDAAKFYAAEVVLALEYLHQLGFLYRDLKPENVMMRADGHLALTDFDLSKLAVAATPKVVKSRHSMSPSAGLTRPLRHHAADKQSSLGKLEIVTSAPILDAESNSFVGTAEYLAPEVVNRRPQSAAVDWWTLGILVYEMLCGATPFVGKDQDETFEKISKGDFKFPSNVLISKEGKSFIKGLLTKDPTKRLGHTLGANAVKSHAWFKSINFGLIREMEAPVRPQASDPCDLSQYKPMKNPEFAKDGDVSDVDSAADSGDEAFARFNLVSANERVKY